MTYDLDLDLESYGSVQVVPSLGQFVHLIKTLATELLRGNSTGLRYTTFSIIIQYADSVHLTAPTVCLYVYYHTVR